MGDFKMPSLGADMDAGKVARWLVKPGDVVHRGDIVAVVETEKSTIEVEVFQAGVVEEILVPEGTEVPVGTALARIGAPAEAGAPAPGPVPPAAAVPAPAAPAPPAPVPAPAAPAPPAPVPAPA
ncbi:MAG TPA: biotin/lipoyl-containing protein, partial [Acidimicrobiales bacterium]|nr:biotin/lipoyl-containing protein [Acidimicrobiales bacterium]